MGKSIFGFTGDRVRVGLAVALLALGLSWLALAAPAHAGVWMQVACVNPDGSAAGSQGWSTGQGDNPPDGVASSSCAPGTPMLAGLNDSAGAPYPDAEWVQYGPPTGSVLDGGSLSVFLSATGTGDDVATAVMDPDLAYDSADIVQSCTQLGASNSPCDNGVDTWSGTVTLPTVAQPTGNVFVFVDCGGSSGYTCNGNASQGYWGYVQVNSARILLSATDTPTATNFSGSALDQTVTGTASLAFTASVSSGPGIYQVNATIDGQSIYSATPDSNGGACSPVGTDPTSGALMFDASQPCPLSDNVSIPVPTGSLSDGPHQLVVTVTDAARNTATVLNQTITTDNTPAPTPTPTPTTKHHKGQLRTSFLVDWRWKGAHTRIRTISVSKLPKRASVTLVCSGRHCPRLPAKAIPGAKAKTLLKALRGRRFHAGDRLLITVSRAHDRSERIEVTFRRDKRPAATLLAHAPKWAQAKRVAKKHRSKAKAHQKHRATTRSSRRRPG